MFCRECGSEIDKDAKFCANCGASVTGEQPSTINKTKDSVEPWLVLKPRFISWVAAFSVIPIQLFMTVWCAVLFGGVGGALIRENSLNIPVFLPGLIFGCLGFFGIPFFTYFVKKKTYKKTEYRFYKDRLEYDEGFWTINNKKIKTDKITEISIRKGIIQRQYNLGTIYLATPATNRSGIKLQDIEDPEKVYEIIEKMIG